MSTSGLSFSGLFSGLDTEEIIEQLMYVEEAPVRLLETKQYKLEYEKTALEEVNNSLLSLQKSISSFLEFGSIYDYTVSSENESVLTGSANSAAVEGTYEVEVQSLAQANIISSDTKADTWTWDPTSGLQGDFDILTENGTGTVFNITVEVGDDLATICAKINSATSGSDNFSDYGTAELITDPSTGNQTIILKAANTGEANRLHVLNTATGENAAGEIGFRSGGSLNEIQEAQNAVVVIDGVTVESATNVVEDALSGVTFALYSTNVGSPIEVFVGMNDDDIVDQIAAFIEQFNTTTELLNDYMDEEKMDSDDIEYTSDYAVGILQNDSDLAMAKADIRLKTTGYTDSSLSTYNILAQIGISSESSSGSYVSSSLEFDEDEFRAALADNEGEVMQLLQGWAEQLDEYLEGQTEVSVIESEAGNFYRRMLNIDDQLERVEDDIETWEERLAIIEEQMRDEFTAMEEALSELQTQSDYLTSQLEALSSSSS